MSLILGNEPTVLFLLTFGAVVLLLAVDPKGLVVPWKRRPTSGHDRARWCWLESGRLLRRCVPSRLDLMPARLLPG